MVCIGFSILKTIAFEQCNTKQTYQFKSLICMQFNSQQSIYLKFKNKKNMPDKTDRVKTAIKTVHKKLAQAPLLAVTPAALKSTHVFSF